MALHKGYMQGGPFVLSNTAWTTTLHEVACKKSLHTETQPQL